MADNNSNAPIAFSTTGLPSSYCFSSFTQLNLDIVAALFGYLPGNYSTFIVQADTPAIADRGKLWIKLDVGGNPVGLFKYANGYWVWPNTEPPNSIVRRFVEATEADVWSYDGGDGTDPSTNIPTDNTGSMWAIDHAYDARMAIAAGTLQPSATVIAVGDTGGVDQVTQATNQMPPHSHDLKGIYSNANSAGSGLGTIGDSQAVYDTYSAAGRVFTNPAGVAVQSTGGSGSPSAAQPMKTISPYRTGYYIKRTARVNYVGA